MIPSKINYFLNLRFISGNWQLRKKPDIAETLNSRDVKRKTCFGGSKIAPYLCSWKYAHTHGNQHMFRGLRNLVDRGRGGGGGGGREEGGLLHIFQTNLAW